MLISLFLKECKAVLKSASYILFVIAVILFYYFQIGTLVPDNIENASKTSQSSESQEYNPLIKPVEGLDFYGTKAAEIPEQIMPVIIFRLSSDIEKDNFSTYPFGFHRSVTLNESELSEMKKIVEFCTGKSYNEVCTLGEDMVPIICCYDEFKQQMKLAEKLIGKNSSYSYESYSCISHVSLTYEEAMAEYNDLVHNDKVSGTYARLFSDYMNIVAVFFSVFVAVSYLMRDKRHGINEIMFAQKAGSAKIILTKYVACIIMLVIPFIAISILPSIRLICYGASSGISISAFAYLKYIAGWILPSIMISVSVGFIITILTDSHLGLFIWFAVAFISLVRSVSMISGGNYKLNLAIRFNELGHYDTFREHFTELMVNRLWAPLKTP